ncbi:putative cysteine desulfurase [bacterium HR28]|nr:putative cysteine desulfurase [bacterium HR28]
MYDLASVRAQLPTLRSFTYLNTGTLGLMAEPVLARYREAVERAQRFGHLVLEEFQEASEGVRSELAELLGVRSEELAFTGNTTDGIALVLASFPFEAGDRILTSDQEHPAVLLPLTLACRRRGVVVERFRVGTEKEETQEAFGAALMRTRPRLVVVSHVSCETGVRLPIEDMTQMAQAEGARVLLDTAQSIGQFPVNLAGLGVDFAAGNGHKWLHGPQGTGFLYVRQDNLDLLEPPLVGDGAVVPPFDRHSFQFDGTNWYFGVMLVGSSMAHVTWRVSSGWVPQLSILRALVGRQLHSTRRAWSLRSGSVSNIILQFVGIRRPAKRTVPDW